MYDQHICSSHSDTAVDGLGLIIRYPVCGSTVISNLCLKSSPNFVNHHFGMVAAVAPLTRISISLSQLTMIPFREIFGYFLILSDNISEYLIMSSDFFGFFRIFSEYSTNLLTTKV